MRHPVDRAGPIVSKQSLFVAIIVTSVLCLAQPLRWLEQLETRLTDLRFLLRGGRPVSKSIVIVAIDDEAVERYPTLPADPHLHAMLIRRLTAIGVSAIGLDIPELARPIAENAHSVENLRPYEELAAALTESGRVVLPLVWVPGKERSALPSIPPVSRSAIGKGTLAKPLELRRPRILHPRADLCAAAAGLGALNVHPDRDWTVRQAPLVLEASGVLYPTLATAMLQVASRSRASAIVDRGSVRVAIGRAQLRANEAGEIPINFAGPDGTYLMVPFADLLEGDAILPDTAQALRGKLVLVGSTAVVGPSRLRTPFSPYMTGVELNANILDTVITGRKLSIPGTGVGMALTALAALVAVFLAAFLPPARAMAAVALLVAAIGNGSMLAFSAGVLLPTAGPLLAGGGIGALFTIRRAMVLRAARRRESERVRSRMSALAGVGRLLNSGLNRDELLTQILLWVEDEIGCEAASVVLRTDDGKLSFEVALGPKASEIKDVKIEIGQGIVGAVVATGEPLVVPDAERDPRFAREIAAAVGFPARSIVCVPMAVRGEVIGAIEVINKRDATSFTDHDVALLTVIGQHAAMFLETARLYGVLERRVDLANQELRIANQQLSAEKAKLEAIVHHMADGIVAADEQGRIVLVNQAAEEMLGVREETLFGSPAASALPNPELAELFAASPDEPTSERELTLGDPVQRIVRARSAVVVDEHGIAGRVVVMNDITDLRELDRTKTDMVSFVSHELKTPLTTIKGFAGLLRDRAEEADSREFADIISRQAERMFRLIDDFLNIARIDMGRDLEMRWEWIRDVMPIIEEAIAAQPFVGPKHRFSVDVQNDLPPLRADPDKLYHILLNLINNAVKYSPDGGEIKVSVRLDSAAHALHFAVKDQGIGIHPENMQHLFKRFRRVADGFGERVEGTGLGLFLTRHLVLAHGGKVWAESAPGQGSTFHFLLPLEGDAKNDSHTED